MSAQMANAEAALLAFEGAQVRLLHSTFDRGFWAIGATVDLVVPASFFVLVGNLGCLTRGSLLARSEFGRLAGRFSSREWLGERTVCLIGPTAVVLHNFISNSVHLIDPRSYIKSGCKEYYLRIAHYATTVTDPTIRNGSKRHFGQAFEQRFRVFNYTRRNLTQKLLCGMALQR